TSTTTSSSTTITITTTTTSTTEEPPTTSSTTTVSTTTSSTLQPSSCGNGFIDTGEECDSSAGGGIVQAQCQEGELCVDCHCVPNVPTTSSTSSTTETSTTTTTLVSSNCGNGSVDPGEDCDSSAGGGIVQAQCQEGELCINCHCAPQTTTSITSTTTSTTVTSTSTTSTIVPPVCGNGVLEPGEQCHSAGGAVPCLRAGQSSGRGHG